MKPRSAARQLFYRFRCTKIVPMVTLVVLFGSCSAPVKSFLFGKRMISISPEPSAGSVPEECKICEIVQGGQTWKSPSQPVVCRHIMPIKLALTNKARAYRGESIQ